jgi:hypothetical protein
MSNNHVHYHVDKRKKYGFLHLLFDFIMVLLTGGLWLIWILIRFMRSNTR